MLWTKDQIVELIEMLQASPSLWDTRCKQYRDRNIKFKDMSKITSRFKTNVHEINRKIKSLRTQFARERKRISARGGISQDKLWFGYQMMSFLLKNNTSEDSEVCIYYFTHS